MVENGLTFIKLLFSTMEGIFICECCPQYVNDQRTSMYNAVTQAEAWEWLRTFSGESFMFSQDPMVSKISNLDTNADNHSGASFGCCMRVMEYIAKNGWVAWTQLRH